MNIILFKCTPGQTILAKPNPSKAKPVPAQPQLVLLSVINFCNKVIAVDTSTNQYWITLYICFCLTCHQVLCCQVHYQELHKHKHTYLHLCNEHLI